jgi:hypothetical protein
VPASGSGVLQFDIAVLDSDGTVLVEIEDYTLRRVSDVGTQLKGLTRQEYSGVITNDRLLSGAILSREGAEVFRRILQQPRVPQLVVSPMDLDALIREWNFKEPGIWKALGKSQVPKVLHARPEIETPFVAPRNEVEVMIATVWQELLGIEAIGVDDDFFAIGGDSLLGIRVVSRLRDIFPVELSPATLFESPTVARLADVILAALAQELSS